MQVWMKGAFSGSDDACGTDPRRQGDPAQEDLKLEAVWARDEDDVRSAQRLRYQVFMQEMGARAGVPASEGLDRDRFDPFCEHLLVRTVETPFRPAEVIGTYRVLLPDAARRAGGLYTETEFDIGTLAHMRDQMAELGRSCVRADWRTGGVILLLWSSLAKFMRSNRIRWMVGCASVPMADGGHHAASLWSELRMHHLAPASQHVRPLLPLPVERLRCNLDVATPPLIKGYLRCGAKLLGPPAWDPDFGTADLPVLLDMEAMPTAYRRRLLQAD